MSTHSAPPPRRNELAARRGPWASAAKKPTSSENGTATVANGSSKPTSPNQTLGERTVKKMRLLKALTIPEDTKALTIPEDTTVSDVCRRMAARRVDAVLLTDSNGLLSGIVTDKDIATRFIAEGLRTEQTLISKIMTRNPMFVMAADTLAIEALQKMVQVKQEMAGLPSALDGSNQIEKTLGRHDDDDGGHSAENIAEGSYPILTGKQKKLFDLRLKMNEARKANQTAMVAEKKKMEAPAESRGISKQNWLDERKKKIGKLLDSNGLDMSKAYMLDTQEVAEVKYKKWEKEPAPFGWDVFNQKTLYDAYKKRTKNIKVDMEAYNKSKEADPEFYRDASSLQYGKVAKTPEENIDRMVKELQDREAKKGSFSRRRKFHDEKDIDSINDRNEHFNKKIERAFGKYTLEIKNNLERGTALPD